MNDIVIRSFKEEDAPQVRELHIRVNRLLSPPDLRDAFEAYIERSLVDEIDRIQPYYAERDGGFWVAILEGKLVGMFGLERASPHSMELRRMYVEPSVRRQGIGQLMLRFAEDECRRRKAFQLELCTAEIQSAALALYKSAGYQILREEFAPAGTNKTVGAGLRRFYLEKHL